MTLHLLHNIVPIIRNQSNRRQFCTASYPQDTSPPLSINNIKHVQQVISSILFYARAVDLAMLMALSSIASKQSKGTDSTMKKCKQLLDHLASHPDASIGFFTPPT
jgi:hypothetical protein